MNTNPSASDSDGDGLDDREEIQQTFTDPLDEDSDNDTLSDYEESIVGSNANLYNSPVTHPALDSDDDGLNNAREHLEGTDPEQRDSDSDGLIDGQEHNLNSDPLDGDSPVTNGSSDSDGDGLSAASEYLVGSDPENEHDPVTFGSRDLDGDNLPNAADPDYLQTGDEDHDGIRNQVEYDTDEDPLDSDRPTLGGAFDIDGDGTVNGVDPDFLVLAGDDSDNDGLSDAVEYALGINATDLHQPLTGGAADHDTDSTLNTLDADYDALADDDNDGWNNEFEYRAGTDISTANVSADFASPVITQLTSVDSVIKKYNLPDTGSGTPFYSHNPHSLATVSISSSTALETSRHLHAGFSGDSISYSTSGGAGLIINNTPRKFKNLALQNTVTGEITRVSGSLRPFSQTLLSATIDNAKIIEPNPLGLLQVDAFQTRNLIDESKRVSDEFIDDYTRLALGHKLALNHPTLWQAYIDYSTSGCDKDICQSTTSASSSLARWLYQEKPIAFALLDTTSNYTRMNWQNRLALKASDLVDYTHYQQARGISLGLAVSNAMVSDFAASLDTLDIYPLSDAAAQGTVWTEDSSAYALDIDNANKTLRFKLYSSRTPAALFVFNEDPASDLVSLSFDGPTGEFVLALSDNQWATGRLALTVEATDGSALPAMLFQWSETTASWTDEALACANGTDQACHD